MRQNDHLEHLRRLAKQLKKGKGITYCQALDSIAQSMGYNNWARLADTGVTPEGGIILKIDSKGGNL